MKQFRFKKAVSFLLAIAITGATAISSSTVIAPLAPITAQAASKASITLNMKKTTIYVGESDTLSVKKVKGLKSKAVTFKSSKPSVVAVSSKGKISAKKAGTAKITVTSKSNKAIKAICTITVQQSPATYEINLEKTDWNEQDGAKFIRMNILDTYQLKILSIEGVSTKDVIFKSSKPKVVSIDKKGVIKALSQGESVITVTSVRNPKAITQFEVNVSSGEGNEYLTKEDFDISGFYDGGATYNGKVYDNYIDFVDAGGKGTYLVTYMQKGKDFYADGDWKTFQTNRGIKFGDSLEDVVKAYNNIYWFMQDKSKFTKFNTEDHVCKHAISFSYKPNAGIIFYLDQDDKVMAISFAIGG